MSISILTSIALGGAIGAVARYSIDRLFSLILGPGILGILIVNISGYLLLVTGVLILTNQLQALGFYLIEYFPILQKLG